MNGSASAPDGNARRMRPCPICSKLSTQADYPFCSDRCAKIDLHRWMVEGYSIPAVETDDDDDEAEGGEGR